MDFLAENRCWINFVIAAVYIRRKRIPSITQSNPIQCGRVQVADIVEIRPKSEVDVHIKVLHRTKQDFKSRYVMRQPHDTVEIIESSVLIGLNESEDVDDQRYYHHAILDKTGQCHHANWYTRRLSTACFPRWRTLDIFAPFLQPTVALT